MKTAISEEYCPFCRKLYPRAKSLSKRHSHITWRKKDIKALDLFLLSQKLMKKKPHPKISEYYRKLGKRGGQRSAEVRAKRILGSIKK